MAVNAYMKIDGIEGESHDERHPGEIEVTSFSWGVNNMSSIGSATGGAGGGKASFQDFHFTKMTDKASPKLFAFCASGKHIPKAELTVRKAGGSGDVFMKIDFEDVVVSSFSEKQNPPDEEPQDAVSLNFARIGFVVIGGDGERQAAGWDLKMNKEIIAI